MSSGGSCRSPSIRTTTSPVATCMPLVKAAWEPKFREWVMTTRDGSAAAMAARISSASSGLASLTKMISRSTSSRPRTSTSRRYICATAGPSR